VALAHPITMLMWGELAAWIVAARAVVKKALDGIRRVNAR